MVQKLNIYFEYVSWCFFFIKEKRFAVEISFNAVMEDVSTNQLSATQGRTVTIGPTK